MSLLSLYKISRSYDKRYSNNPGLGTVEFMRNVMIIRFTRNVYLQNVVNF